MNNTGTTRRTSALPNIEFWQHGNLLSGIVIDNEEAMQTGAWIASTFDSHFVGES